MFEISYDDVYFDDVCFNLIDRRNCENNKTKLKKLTAAINSDGYIQELSNIDGKKIKRKFVLKELFDAVQTFGMKNEEYSSEELRELYAEGSLFHVGDVVESQTTGLVGEIHRCGANHLIVVTEDGIMFKSFIHDVYAI